MSINDVTSGALIYLYLHRLKEYRRCEGILNQMKKNSTNDESTLKQLNRHYAILSREITIDNNEKNELEREFETYIEKALIQYGEVLRLSGDPDVHTVNTLKMV